MKHFSRRQLLRHIQQLCPTRQTSHRSYHRILSRCCNTIDSHWREQMIISMLVHSAGNYGRGSCSLTHAMWNRATAQRCFANEQPCICEFSELWFAPHILADPISQNYVKWCLYRRYCSTRAQVSSSVQLTNNHWCCLNAIVRGQKSALEWAP